MSVMRALRRSDGSTSPEARAKIFSYWPTLPKNSPPKVGDWEPNGSISMRVMCASADKANAHSTPARTAQVAGLRFIICSSRSVVVLFPAVALGQADQAALARRIDRAVLVAGREVDEDGVDVADADRAAGVVEWLGHVVAKRLQFVNLGLVEPRLARDRVAGRRHRDARRLDRLLDSHVVIHQVDEHVVDRADHGGATRRAEGGDRLAALEEDGGRHAAARPLTALDIVGPRSAEGFRTWIGAEVEVSELVVEHETVAGNHDPRSP